MITVEPSEIKLTDQINALQTEIATRTLDIQNLQEALDTLIAGKPRPINPSADGAFEMLRELVGNVSKSMEEQQLYQGKLQQAQRSLELAIALCKEKQLELEGLHQKQNEIQAEQLFEQVKAKAERFNVCITEVLTLLNEIKRHLQKLIFLSE